MKLSRILPSHTLRLVFVGIKKTCRQFVLIWLLLYFVVPLKASQITTTDGVIIPDGDANDVTCINNIDDNQCVTAPLGLGTKPESIPSNSDGKNHQDSMEKIDDDKKESKQENDQSKLREATFADHKISIPWGEPQIVEGELAVATRKVLEETYKYMTTVVSDKTYDWIRDECRNEHELCSFWAASGASL